MTTIRLLVVTALIAVRCAAQTSAPAPLGLPRLDQQAPTGAPPLAKNKFADADLTAKAVAGARAGEKRGAKFLSLDVAADWSQPLRGKPGDTLFVSFSVNGSAGTIVEIGGAKVGIVDSEIAGCVQLVVADPAATGSAWRRLALHVPVDRYESRLLGSFSVLTARLDPAHASWDLYQGARMLAVGLPLNPATKHAEFVVHAGEAGAMINGLVQSDENPLYEDANANGLDDRFEQARKGRLLTGADTQDERKALIAQWRADQLSHPAPALFVNLPAPDGK